MIPSDTSDKLALSFCDFSGMERGYSAIGCQTFKIYYVNFIGWM